MLVLAKRIYAYACTYFSITFGSETINSITAIRYSPPYLPMYTITHAHAHTHTSTHTEHSTLTHTHACMPPYVQTHIHTHPHTPAPHTDKHTYDNTCNSTCANSCENNPGRWRVAETTQCATQLSWSTCHCSNELCPHAHLHGCLQEYYNKETYKCYSTMVTSDQLIASLYRRGQIFLT